MNNTRPCGGVEESAVERFIITRPRLQDSKRNTQRVSLRWPSSDSGCVTLESIWRKHLISTFGQNDAVELLALRNCHYTSVYDEYD